MLLLVLPALGVSLADLPLKSYLEFPPQTRFIQHAPFSRVAFAAYTLVFLAALVPLLLKGFLKGFRAGDRKARPFAFPWWGRLGLITGSAGWVLAWTRFDWYAVLQPHTFTPLWLSYILVINALTYRRRGHCLLIDRPLFFLLLFPASALFWWFFEYLNRFVQNWHYVGVQFSAGEYFLYATLSFSTVLPAVLGTREWLLGSERFKKGFSGLPPVRVPRPKILAWLVLLLSGLGLSGVGVWPDYLFGLLWVSPLLIVVSLQTLWGEKHVLTSIRQGNWVLIISSALAALVCGFFWEMWNYFSLAKWEYTVPFVQGCPIFEMPLPGYAGYLPFGLECAVVADLLQSVTKRIIVRQ